MPEPSDRVLVVEDDPGVAELQRRRLERAGYRVAVAPAAAAARAALADDDVAVVLLDYHLPDVPDGLAFYHELQAAGYTIPIILVTGRADDQVVTAALRAGVKDYVTKSLVYLDYLPEAVGRVLAQVRETRERRRAQEELARANERLEHALAEMQAQTEELRATTQQLWQAAKLATVGELAASIAHEVNNPLGTVSLRLESVLARTPADDPRAPALRVIEQEVDRMARLIGNLLQFSRHNGDRISSVDITEEVQRSVELIEYHLRRRRVATRYEFAAGVPPVLADQQKLRQVFLNLFTNAADAMPAGGTLTMRVSRAPGGDRPAVLIEVADTGAGIAPEQLRRVFDPFFSTKAEGKGTGLGLAICRRIVQEHGGDIGIESRPGRGTTVRVALPLNPANSPAGQSGMRLQEAQPPGWAASLRGTPDR